MKKSIHQPKRGGRGQKKSEINVDSLKRKVPKDSTKNNSITFLRMKTKVPQDLTEKEYVLEKYGVTN